MPRELPTSRTGSAPSLPVAPEPYRHGVSRKPKLFQDNLFYEVPMFTDDTARSHVGHRMRWRLAIAQRLASSRYESLTKLRRTLSPSVPLYPRQELDERSQRPHLLQGRIPPVLSIQSVRKRVGPYELGTYGQPRSGPVAASAGCHSGREWDHDFLRKHCRG